MSPHERQNLPILACFLTHFLNFNYSHRTPFFPWALRVIGLILVLGLSVPALAQNTKGDKPASNRESRFRLPSKKSNQKRTKAPGKRVSTKKKSMSYNATNYSPRRRAKGGERPGKPTRPISGTKPQGTQKAWTGDLAGRRIRAKSA